MANSVSKKALKDNLKQLFAARIFGRGVDYYESGQVESLRAFSSQSAEIDIRAEIIGSDEYKTSLFFDLNKNRFRDPDCACPYGDNCKHEAALGLEFIDLYEEFMSESKVDDPRELRNKLVAWINKQPKARNYTFDEFDEDKSRENDEDIIEAESAEIKDIYKKRTKDDLLRELTTALDFGNAPASVVDELIRELESLKNKTNFQKNDVIILPAPGVKLAARQKSKPQSKLNINDYHLVLEPGYSNQIVRVKVQKGNSPLEAKLLLAKCGDLTKPQKELLKILDRIDFYYSDYSREKLFNLLRDSNLKIYWAEENKKIELKFPADTAPCLLIDYNNKKDTLEIKAAIDYGFEKIDVRQSVNRSRYCGQDCFERYDLDKYVLKISENSIDYAPVKKNQEIELYQKFCYFGKEYGFKRNLECKAEGEKEVSRYFVKYWENIKKLDYKIEFIRDEFKFSQENFKADFEVDLNAANDWLGFDVNCYCGQDQITLEVLKSYVENKKDFIKMSDGRLLKIANLEDLERFILMLESFYKREQGGFEGRLYHAPELEYVLTNSKYYNAKIKESFANFIREAQSGKPVEKVKLAPRFAKILRDYQKEGVNWFYFLRKYRFAGILADDMGLGKTLQALVLIEKEKVKDKPSIVVCPKTLLYNWQIEAEKFTPGLKTVVIDGFPETRKTLIKKAKKFDLVITGYATMKKDCEIYDQENIRFNYCVLDEAQFIKNHATKNAQIMKKINADYRIALTGTPLENSVSEIWSIFDFLMPGFLGSYKLFCKKFHNPIMKQNSAAALNSLRKKVEYFMLRRVKSEVLKELPPKVEQVSHCHLEKAQNILYQEILANVKNEIFKTVAEKGFNKSRIHILAGLTKLRQVCNHPVLLLKDKNYAKYESAKLNMFCELISEIIGNKRKVLVFSQFTKMLDILAQELDKENIGYCYLSGKTVRRQEVVRDFNENDSKKVFLISIKAGGTGLNLTSADNVIIFDPWWNPSVENQAIDRTHRIGQKNSVNVYRLITKGTIEEKIVKLQERKKFLFDNLVGESKNLFEKLTWEDVKELFNST